MIILKQETYSEKEEKSQVAKELGLGTAGAAVGAGVGALSRYGLKKGAEKAERLGDRMIVGKIEKDASGKVKNIFMNPESPIYKLGDKINRGGKRVVKVLDTKAGKVVAIAVPAGIAAVDTVAAVKRSKKKKSE